ncbi:MAG: hypothetical protein WBC19_08895 [Pyrinomonadaceae bacterium]|nr:hypothetical protein [Chloracidobacterium sp.]
MSGNLNQNKPKIKPPAAHFAPPVARFALPVSSGDPPTPTGNTPAPAGNTPAPAGDTPTPAGNTPTLTGNTPAPAGNTPNPVGNTAIPTADKIPAPKPRPRFTIHCSLFTISANILKMNMATYTFFLEYGGGTYISQIQAPSKDLAPKIWISQFDLPTRRPYRKLFEKDFQKKVIESLDLNLISAIDGVINTWDFSAYGLDEPSTIHFVKTAPN